MSAICEICGKEFKTTQGLRGHKTFVHQIASSKEPTAQPVTEQQLAELEDRLQKLESITGVKEPSALDRLLGTNEPAIIDQLQQHTHQLAELSEQLTNLSRQLKLASSNTEFRNVSRKVTQLSEQVKRHDSWLTPDPVVAIFSKDSYDRPAFLHDLDRLQTRVKDHQGAIDWVRKKFNLVKKGQRKLA